MDAQHLSALADQNDAAQRNAEEFRESSVPTRVPTAVVWEAYTGIDDTASDADSEALRGLYERLLTAPGHSI